MHHNLKPAAKVAFSGGIHKPIWHNSRVNLLGPFDAVGDKPSLGSLTRAEPFRRRQNYAYLPKSLIQFAQYPSQNFIL
jgi:hypothetical protein